MSINPTEKALHAMGSPPTTTELWMLTRTVRTKLLSESSKPDPPLRLLVGHANLLDQLVSKMCRHSAEEEFDLEAGTVEDTSLDPSDSESDSTDSDSDAESNVSSDSDLDGCGESGSCRWWPKPGPESCEEMMETGIAESCPSSSWSSQELREPPWRPSPPERVRYHQRELLTGLT